MIKLHIFLGLLDMYVHFYLSIRFNNVHGSKLLQKLPSTVDPSKYKESFPWQCLDKSKSLTAKITAKIIGQ